MCAVFWPLLVTHVYLTAMELQFHCESMVQMESCHPQVSHHSADNITTQWPFMQGNQWESAIENLSRPISRLILNQGQRSGLAEWLMTNTWVTVSKKCGQIFITDFRHSNRTEITFHIYTAVNISGLCLRLHLYWWSKQKPTPLLVLCQMPFQLQYNPTNLSWVDRGTESRWSAYPTTWS